MIKAPKDIVKFLRESNFIEGVFDAASLDQAILAWDFLTNHGKLTHDVILKTHKIISLNSNLQPNEKGYYRQVPVWVGGREGADWKKIEFLMDAWIYRVNEEPSNWKEHHIFYEKTHPFVDFNGRTGRMFLNWERLKASLPILVIKNSEKQDYYSWFI